MNDKATRATKICSPHCGEQWIGVSFQLAKIADRFYPHFIRYCPERIDGTFRGNTLLTSELATFYSNRNSSFQTAVQNVLSLSEMSTFHAVLHDKEMINLELHYNVVGSLKPKDFS